MLVLGNLIDEEPGSEEEADAQENEGEMGENSWVDWRHISRQSVQSSHGHLAICKFGNYLSQMPSPLKAGLIMSNSVHCPSKNCEDFPVQELVAPLPNQLWLIDPKKLAASYW